MKTSDRLIVIGISVVALLMVGVNGVLYSQLLSGHAASIGRDQEIAHTATKLGPAHFLVIDGVPRINIIPSDKDAIDYPQLGDPPGLRIKDDTIWIIGSNTSSVNLPYIDWSMSRPHAVNVYTSSLTHLHIHNSLAVIKSENGPQQDMPMKIEATNASVWISGSQRVAAKHTYSIDYTLDNAYITLDNARFIKDLRGTLDPTSEIRQNGNNPSGNIQYKQE